MNRTRIYYFVKMSSTVPILILLASVTPLGRGENLTTSEKYVIEDSLDVIQDAVTEAITNIKPALVRIHVVTVRDDQGREVKRESIGSGVIITRDGHVVTNHHVAGRAKRIVCTLFSKEEVEADLVGTDPLSDISVIKLRYQEKIEFPFAAFGNSDSLKVGDQVFAMGSPLALSQSVTMGIVSNTELVIPEIFEPFKFTLEGEDVGSIVRWIGHDAAIYPGNSGGPLVNLNGEIVGINEISFGIGGAIPSNLAKKVAEELIQCGKVTRSWLGFEVQPLLKHSDQKKGILISSVIEGSPADRSGFLPGDILISIGEKEVTVRFREELPLFNQLVTSYPIGEKIEAVVLRQEKKKTLSLVPQEREYIRPRAVELKKWGITARNISLLAAKEMKRKNQDGVLVTSVRPGGPCGEAKPKVMKDDVIVEVDGRSVKNIDDLLALTEKITSGKTEFTPVLVTFERKNDQYLTVVKIGIKKLGEQGQEIRKAWLGVATQVLTKGIAEMLDIAGNKGVRVTQVFKNSPAKKAGIKVGDVIVAINGQPIPASDPADIEVFPTMIRKYDMGSKVKLTILRNKKESDLIVELGSSPKLPREMKKYRDDNFEFTVRDIAFMDYVQERWEKKQIGVLVVEVSRGSWAALENLLVGDLILAVDNEPVKNVDSFERIMTKVVRKKPKSVVFKVLRGIHNLFIELEPDWTGVD